MKSAPRRPPNPPTAGWRSIFRRPAATASPRCWPSAATRPSALREHQLVASGGPGPALAAAQRRIPRADGIPPVFDPVVPDGGGDGGLARLRADPQPVDARPDRPGRGAAVLLRRALRRLPGRPSDLQSVVSGKSVSVREELGGRRTLK